MRRLTIVWTLLCFLIAGGCVPDDNVGADTSTTPDTGIDAETDAGGDTGGLDAGTDSGGLDARADATDAGLTDADAGDARTDTGYLPLTERGPYNVGFETMTVTLQRKKDGKEENVDLRTVIWYPTRDESGPEARYTVINREGVYAGADPAPVDDMPVLIFSHGNGGIAEQNYFQSEFLASRGWAVVSPEHTGNTIKSGASINIKAAIYRPQDISAVLDRLENLKEDNPLHGKLSDKIAMSGHSFGGYTTLANAGAEYAVEELTDGCENGTVNQDYCDIFTKEGRPELFKKGFYDDRIDVAIPQAPAGNQIFQNGLKKLQIPTMLFTGGMDRTLPNEQEGDPIWEQMKGDQHRRMNLPKAGHFTFSNMCSKFSNVSDQIKNDGCSDDFIDPARAHEIINTYSLAFARYHLFDDQKAKAVIDGDRWPVGMMGFELSVGAN